VGIGVAMTFENEGIYIRDEEREQIFERYFRSKDAIRTDPAGSGIGLALVKEFVEHYKGKIDVRSTEIGFGRYLNVFSLFLPGR
jgi:signal transduction histidine kinase